MSRFFAALWLALLALAAPAAAQNFPEHRGSPVVDQADLLRPEQEFDLKSKSEALYAQTGRSFVVATVKSLDGLTIEDYGYRLGRRWALGGKEDNGVILLVAPKERRVRIETGYGAEGFMPDILVGRIIRDTITPRFKTGDMAGGIMAGADAIIRQMSLSADEASKTVATAGQAEQQRQRSGGGGLPLIFWAMIVGFVLLSMVRRAVGGGRRYRRRHSGGGVSPWVVLWGLSELSRASRGSRGWGGGGGWSGGGGSFGGGGGGGFGGFGGGSFGGGGASGSW